MTSPAKTSSGFCPVAGGEISYEVAGAGPAVVLVHAGIADLRMWDAQVAALVPRYQVIRYDCRGYGQSRSEPVSFSNRQDLADLLDHLGVAQATLVGCSRGGQIALDFALERPERATALVWVCSGVGGYNSPDEIFKPEEIALFEAMEAAEAARDFPRVAALDVRVWVDGPLQPEGRAAEHVRRQIYEMALNNYNRHSHLFDSAFAPQPLNPPAAERLHELRIPVLAMVGDLDPGSTSDSAAFLARQAPNVRVEHFADTAHLPNMEQPERFNSLLIAFLDGA